MTSVRESDLENEGQQKARMIEGVKKGLYGEEMEHMASIDRLRNLPPSQEKKRVIEHRRFSAK